MSIDRRRFACPSLTRPMVTKDGCLARLAPLTAALNADDLAELAAIVQTHGNGLVEVTRRGNLQCRGFAKKDDDTYRPLLGRFPGQEGSRFPISIDPVGVLSGDTATLVKALYAQLHLKLRELDATYALAPKLSLVISAGGGLGYENMTGDIHLRCEPSRIHIGLGRAHLGTQWYGYVLDVGAAVEAVVVLMEAIAEAGPLARARDVADAAVPALRVQPGQPIFCTARRVGEYLEMGAQQSAQILHVPMGRIDVTMLESLSDICRLHSLSVWPIPARALLITGQQVSKAAAALTAIGLSDDAKSSLTAIDACVGSNGCPRSRLDTFACARRLSAMLAPFGGQVSAHISGCPKSCARDKSAAITLVGREDDDQVRCVFGGTPREQPDFTFSSMAEVWPLLNGVISVLRREGKDVANPECWHTAAKQLLAEKGESAVVS